MIYGFIHDTMFKQISTLDYGNTSNPPVCFLDSNIDNYFNNKLTITDPRTQRNSAQYTGTIQICVDDDKIPHPNIFTALTTTELGQLFSLIEKIYTNEIHTETELNELLKANPDYTNFYVDDSLVFGTTTINTGLASEHPGPKTMIDRFNIDVAFGTRLASLCLWMNRAKFAENYPLSTIAKVILPCDIEHLLDPSKFSSIVETIISSNIFSFSSLNTDINSADHTGLITYRTKYVVNSTTIKLMPFGILYKGASPSTVDIRNAIKDLLLNSGTATEEVWENLLPDLFVDGQFFIVPIWDNITIRPDRTLYPSIVNLKKVVETIAKVLPNLPIGHVNTYQELLTVSQCEMFIIAISDSNNPVDKFRLLNLHPTYQYYSPQDQAHIYMTAATKDFNIRLNRCLAALAGESVSEEFITNTFDDVKFSSFVSGRIEYHVLQRLEYLAHV